MTSQVVEETKFFTGSSSVASPAGVFRGDRISSLKIRSPLKTPAGEASSSGANSLTSTKLFLPHN